MILIYAAIKESLEDQVLHELKVGGTPSEILKKFVDDNLDKTSDRYVNIIRNRKNILSSTIRAIERGKLSFLPPVHIKFSGQDGVDAGGPRREFFRLLMRSLTNLGVFQGK